MSKNLVFLLNGDEALCRLDQQILKDNGVEAEIEDYDQNAAFNVYRANSVIGKRIMVPEAKLKEAREILNIDAGAYEKLSPAKSRKALSWVMKGIAIIFLAYFLISLIVNLVSMIKTRMF